MKKFLKRLAVGFIYLFCFIAVIELGVNYYSTEIVFPIKNATSYGYVAKESGKTIIELDKFDTRAKAQLALPFALAYAYFNDKTLTKDYNEETKTYGYKDNNENIVIKHQFIEAEEFVNDYAVVAVMVNGEKKYGTIDIKGNWVIEPKYDYLCPFFKYYTRACIDKGHCGIIDKFGNNATLMTYDTHKLKCKDGECGIKLCTIGKDKKEITCNYFL
ncbi:MAG: WG repeat-containing protein [Candidatus Gastranaerophilales bacterium]|nr:WG repeat-containing protein [Candidatus Gastranaerophilales bacterium]